MVGYAFRRDELLAERLPGGMGEGLAEGIAERGVTG
jgi:hypothetical protein